MFEVKPEQISLTNLLLLLFQLFSSEVRCGNILSLIHKAQHIQFATFVAHGYTEVLVKKQQLPP